MRKFLITFLLGVFTCIIMYAIAVWQGLGSFLFAWILNFLLMVVVLYFTESTKPKLTSNFFESKKWEKEGRIYEWVGINFFRKLLVIIGWEKLNKTNNPVKKDLNTLIQLEYNTRKSEFGHILIFIIVLAVTIFVTIQFSMKETIWLIILNVILNVYPILLQRYNRPRIKRLMIKYSVKNI